MKSTNYITRILLLSLGLTASNALNAQIGVNTITPQKTLHVNGSLQVTNELNVGGNSTTAGSSGTTGQVLVSNGASSAPEWQTINTPNTFGDVKYSFLSVDHSGWIRMDGRAVSSLTSTQQTRAAALGFSSNLPNSTNAYLVQNETTLGSVSGSNTRSLSQNQLPNVTLSATGNTNTTGAHTHPYVDRGNTSYSVATSGATTPIADDTSGNYTTSSAGDHSHTVTVTTSSINGGVTQQSLDVKPLSLSSNTFLYLGT